MNTKQIGRQIAALRKEQGLTQEALAERLQISPQAVSKWENGRALPETALLPALARTLSISIDALLAESQLCILSAVFGDGLESENVTARLQRQVENDGLTASVQGALLGCPLSFNRPKFLAVQYSFEGEVFCAFAAEGEVLSLPENPGRRLPGEREILAAIYGTAAGAMDVMHKIEHYKVFGRRSFCADHETFPSRPQNDDPDFLTFVYANRAGIRLVTCAEGESLVLTGDGQDFIRQIRPKEQFIEKTPSLPAFGGGWECSWAAALTAALQAMGEETTYTEVMGVSGACFRLAFCSPQWDYSSVDGLLLYDHSIPGMAAFGYGSRLVGRVEKENRAAERQKLRDEIDHVMPVLGINLRVAPEWGVLCGYANGGNEFYCRTKYDSMFPCEGALENGMCPVENWPFILNYFEGKSLAPTALSNLQTSLQVFADCAGRPGERGYAMGFAAYTVWQRDLLDGEWYAKSDGEALARRFSVNQFCALSHADARESAAAYLAQSVPVWPEKTAEMEQLAALFAEIAQNARQMHHLLDTNKNLNGEEAKAFWTRKKREEQAALLARMQSREEAAFALVQGLPL